MYKKAIARMLIMIVLLIPCTVLADSVYSNDVFAFIDETRCPYWTFSFDNMYYESITDAEFRQEQYNKFTPVFSESDGSTVYWNQAAVYDAVSEYDITLIDQVTFNSGMLHDYVFTDSGRDYKLDLYSAGDDFIIIAHDGVTIFCTQYINTSIPITDHDSFLSDTDSYFYYYHSTNAITSTTYTLTAFYSNHSVTTITCDANTDEILSVKNDLAPDALINLFYIAANCE